MNGCPRPAAAAVGRARRCDASALEAYPIDPEGAVSEELHVVIRGFFAATGLRDTHTGR
ncbi:MAG: hypothetical protein AVDCRST_MAG21-1566 [uncultured Nocardioidaceae bacterium]|uniref:Uncharacterized protein n=1 Tax=uncultured Nocardioidaceae bacterium TaxID=253824 RepID=A0A6J4N8F1_9ACTN|nr:MAG: hypothetical protein AVDCRST_MAG21-1566 [uncultured Nocardioidaceae bacterium]